MSSNLQLQTTSSNLPTIATPESLAEIRMDEARYPHYRNIPPKARLEWLAGQAKYLSSIARIRDFDAREAILMATSLDEMILQYKDMAELTLPEMADAFKSGVFGIFGEFYGLSAPNLYGFLSSFLESSKKKDATSIVVKSKEEAYREKKREEQEQRQRQIRAEIEAAKRRGEFIPTGRISFKPKMVNDAISSAAHREMVRKQAREIIDEENDTN